MGEGQDVGVAHSGVSCGDCCSGPTLAHVDYLKYPPPKSDAYRYVW